MLGRSVVFDLVPAVETTDRGKPSQRWKEQVERDLDSLGISNWWQTTEKE